MHDKKELTVVAVDVADDGIDSLCHFFRNVDDFFHLAFIVIHHLPKDHQSTLPELLAGTAAIKTVAAEDDMAVCGGHIYVAPAGVGLSLRRGRLHTEKLTERRSGDNVIDDFFTSLAGDCGPRAVCVIFGGSGTDGVKGARAVKERGGMVMAARPSDTGHAALPPGIIASGLADVIAEVELLPTILAAAVRSSGVRPHRLDHEGDNIRLLNEDIRTAETFNGNLHDGEDEGADAGESEAAGEYLQHTLASLEASNEELRVMNEELQTTNEELRQAKQEQQDHNSELVTVNALLHRKIEELDAANSDLFNVYESTRIAMLFLDNDLEIKTFTPAAARLLELDEEDIGHAAGRIDSCFNDVDVAKEARRIIDRFEKRDLNVVHRHNGRHYVMQLRLYRSLANVIEGITIAIIDVDDFKKAKRDLHIRERMLSLVTDTVPMLIAYIDTDGVYRYCNASYISWFGLEKKEVIGRRVADVLGDAVFDTIRPHFLRALTGEPVLYTRTFDLPNLGRRALRVNYDPHVEEGVVKGVIAFIQDETKRVQRERKLGRLAAIVNSSHEVIIGKNTEGIITEWNRGAEDLFGYSAEEAVGAHAFLTVPLEQRERFAALYGRLLEGESIEPFETVRLSRDGERKVVLMNLSSIRSEEGEIIGISAVAHDISDRVEAQRRLSELNEHLEERVAERTEQLRNLATRLMSLEQAERRKLSRLLHDEIQQTLAAAKMLVEKSYGLEQEKARPSLSESLRLLSEAMEQARIITSELSPPLFFETGISVCLQWILRWAETKFSFFVDIAVEGEERPISEETGYFLYRSIRELLFNSYKHGGTEHALVTATFTDDGALVVAVEDQGCGFDSSLIDTPANDHFGVLSIVEQVRAMGGGVEIISEPGAGTRTVLSLPADIVVPAIEEEESPGQVKEALLAGNRRQVEEGGKKPVILIVDDQEDLRFTLRLMLEELSSRYTFVEAEDGRQALDMVEEYAPQLVLMDISMPGMSGVEATKRIKERREDIVVIGLSMHEREDMEAAMRKAGAENYVTKDQASETILEMIEKYL